jgi:hypothetical protein
MDNQIFELKQRIKLMKQNINTFKSDIDEQ